jgi:hypothetical protein
VGVFAVAGPFLAGLLDYEQARNMFLSCPLVLVITLAVNVQSGPAVGVAHEFLHHLYVWHLRMGEAELVYLSGFRKGLCLKSPGAAL